MTYINITKFVLINQLKKDHSMIETRCLKNVVIFIQIMSINSPLELFPFFENSIFAFCNFFWEYCICF